MRLKGYSKYAASYAQWNTLFVERKQKQQKFRIISGRSGPLFIHLVK